MVQDYHLTLVPRMLADRRPDVAIGYFCHTPWAPPDYFAILPDDVGREVLDGILGADHAGFHTQRWADAFLDCCEAVLGAEVDRAGRTVRHRGHTTTVGVHPLGVDAAELRERAAAADVQAHVTALASAAGGRKLIVRIDRTELSKNIVRGLAAYRELLVTQPEWRGQVTHLAFAYPSRHDLPEYREYTASVQRLARQITDEFGTEDWDPLVLQVNDDYARSLAAYRLADVLLVNPIRDGMNLVAKEGPLLSERGCALVLSREAGAVAELGEDALVVNPFDVTETAKALHEALSMPDAERRRRAALLAEAAAAHAAAAVVRRPAQGAGRGDAASERASEPSRAATPSGPSTTRSASAASSLTSPDALHTVRPGCPSSRRARTAPKAGRSPRSSPANSIGPAFRSATRAVSAAPLSIPGGRSSMTSRPGSTTSPVAAASSASGPLSAASAPAGSAVRRVCTASALPLSSIRVPSGAPASASSSRQPRPRRRHARRRRRGGQRAVLPPLPAVVPEHDQPGHPVEPAQLHRLGSRPPGDHRQRPHQPGEPPQPRHRRRVRTGLPRVSHDRRERPVEVHRDQRRTRLMPDRRQPRPALLRPGHGQPARVSPRHHFVPAED